MNKKVLSLVLALVIVLGTFGTVFAATDATTESQKIQWLVDNGVLAGRTVNADGSADLALDSTITRAETTKLVVYTLKLQNLADILKGVIRAFPDVELTHWANGYISVATTQRADVAYGRRIIIGYPDGKFYPENNVTYAELATMLVRIVKKDLTADMEKNAIWATSYMRWAQEEGILAGVTVADSNAPAVRRDAFVMIYNAMAKLGNTNVNAPKFGDVMGVVSKVQAGRIQLNQDANMEYEITWNSRVTDGTTWQDVAANQLAPGALVRLVANEKGEVLYLIELGSPRQGAIDGRWFDVAKKTAETNDFGGRATVAGDAYFFDEYFKKINVAGVQANIDSSTRFFVADVTKNALKEIKTLDEVFRYYVRDYKDLNRVYMGYDDFQGRNEAKVIVFGEVDKYQGGTAIRRVTNYYATNYNITVETTKGVQEVISYANTSYFPRQGYVDKMDVIKLYLNYGNAQSEYGNTVVGGTTFTNYPLGTVKHGVENVGGYEVLIDYSADPVYEISAVNLATRYIELKDEYNYVRRFYIKDADVFLEGQATKGKHVQVVLSTDKTEVEIVSVVDKALEGALPTGVRAGMEDGWIVRYEELPDGRMTVTIAHDRVDGADRNLKTYEVATDWRSFVRANVGKRVVFDVADKFGATPYIYNIELWTDKDVLPGTGALPRLNPMTNNGYAEKGNLSTGEYNKDRITVPAGNAYHVLPRLSEVTLHAPAAPVGMTFVGFKVTEGNVTLTTNVATRTTTFQMPQTGDVKIEAVYEVAADATVKNTGDCPIEIVAVNGVKIKPERVAAGGEATDYLPIGATERVTFKIGDKIIISMPHNEDGTCGTEDCELVGFEVKGLCAAGNIVNAGTLPLTIVNPGPCGGSTCVEIPCAAELELSCVTEIAAVGKSDVKTGNASVVTVQKLANGTYSFAEVNQPYFDVTGLGIVNGKLVGKVVLTEAGKSAKVEIVKVEVTETLPQDHILNADEDFVDGAAFSVNLNGCTELCEFVVEINVQYTESCAPCEQGPF